MARSMSDWGKRLNIVARVERAFSVPCSTLDTTSIRGTRLNCWNIIAHRACQRRLAAPFSAVTSCPSNKIAPDVASVSRLIIRNSVDLPAPDRPMMPIIAGLPNVRLTRSTAVLAPNAFVRFWIVSIVTPPRLASVCPGKVEDP